jgi:hypothetical protein
MYGFDETTATGGGNFGKIAAGIVENIHLKDISYDHLKADGSGDKVIKFVFADDAGATFTHIEFPIDFAQRLQLAKGWGKSTADAEAYVKQEYEAQGERIKHILSCFIPKDKCVVKAESFEQFAQGIIKLIGDNHRNVPVRIKTVYKGTSGYTTFPKRALKPFIQNMKEPNRLSIDSKWDNITPPVPDNDTYSTSAVFGAEKKEQSYESADEAPW